MDTATEIGACLEAKRAAVTDLEEKRAAVALRLLEAPESERGALVQERAMLAAEHLALSEETGELHRRYCVAAIAPYEEREVAALGALAEAMGRATQQRLAMNVAIEEQRGWQATGRAELTVADGNRAAAEWDGKVARLSAECQIAADAANDAARVSERLHIETEAMRERLAGPTS